MAEKMTLIIGGARSGKSTFAQTMVEQSGQSALFVATATPGDDEMAARIKVHQESRPASWTTLEAALEVGDAIRSAPERPWVLIDCITLLASNVLFSLPEPVDEHLYAVKMDAEIASLIRTSREWKGRWVIVTNEVGLGLVPPYPLGRLYRDVLGRTNQQLAAAADEVLLLVAGIPLKIKG
jgi:adenosylcobinamide kinase/adenosylcobinamide-phosphate guanylyltransferase